MYVVTVHLNDSGGNDPEDDGFPVVAFTLRDKRSAMNLSIHIRGGLAESNDSFVAENAWVQWFHADELSSTAEPSVSLTAEDGWLKRITEYAVTCCVALSQGVGYGTLDEFIEDRKVIPNDVMRILVPGWVNPQGELPLLGGLGDLTKTDDGQGG